MTQQNKLYEAAKAVLYGWASRLTRPRSEWNEKLQALADAISAYEQEQPEAIAGEKTARDFICSDCHTQWDVVERTISYDIYGTERMMERYASQQTSAKDKEIAELKEAPLQAEIDRLKKEVERLESSDAWINLSDEKPIEEKMCQCYCPDEPIDIVQIGFWDNNYGFIDNNDHPVNAEKWKYVKLPLAIPPTTKLTHLLPKTM